MAKKTGFSEQLRQAIAHSGFTLYRIAKLTDVQQSQLSRFMRGERGLSIDGIEKICELISARLVTNSKRPARKTKGG